MLGRLALIARQLRGERLLTRATLSNFFTPYSWLKLPSRESLAIMAQQSEYYDTRGHRSLTILALAGAGLLSPLLLHRDHSPWDLQNALKVECSGYKDKYIQSAMTRLDNGVRELQYKYPDMKRPVFQAGLRGTRYYIEFPISDKKVDAVGIVAKLKEKMQELKGKGLVKENEDSFRQVDSISFLLDYKVPSDSAPGSKHKGTIYVRGVTGQKYDQFKFICEKEVEFSDLDINLILEGYEQAFKPKHDQMNMSSSAEQEDSIRKKWKRRGSAKESPKSGVPGTEGSSAESDPQTVLEQAGCTVFVPGVQKHLLDWNYLAGYEQVKRDIEDTVLLALTHGHVYDQITSKTRMKNETNRPKCVLFEGPPGCGKTTSAKIISQQVNIPLVYMPLEAIMSKYYGESENRLADIFEASKALGKVILFIDEIDSLATSREAGLHEATRRILSTLLRKIDSFESDGEVLVICATNRKRDLDPALVSRLDIAVRFDLPDAQTRGLIFQRYAKQLKQEDLKKLGEISINLSGRDIADICKDAERRWASKYIRKEVENLSPQFSIYEECTQGRVKQMEGVNLRMDKARPLF